MALKIMIVDDNKEFCESISDVLEMQGHTAVSSLDGEKAIALVKDDPPDVVLLDMVMPGLDGLETLRRIKVLAPGLPVIMISGFSSEENHGAAVQEGLCAFLRKPIDFDELFTLIEAGVKPARLADRKP